MEQSCRLIAYRIFNVPWHAVKLVGRGFELNQRCQRVCQVGRVQIGRRQHHRIVTCLTLEPGDVVDAAVKSTRDFCRGLISPQSALIFTFSCATRNAIRQISAKWTEKIPWSSFGATWAPVPPLNCAAGATCGVFNQTTKDVDFNAPKERLVAITRPLIEGIRHSFTQLNHMMYLYFYP